MTILRSLGQLVVLLLALVALGFLLVLTALAAPFLWVLQKRKPFVPEIPQDLWKPHLPHVDWGGHDGT